MRTLFAAALVAGATLAMAAPASARQGCGMGFHRVGHGRCVPNRRGAYYHGYGWWDGHRYWQHRERWHGHWRYR